MTVMLGRLVVAFSAFAASVHIAAQPGDEPTRYVRSFINALGWANEAVVALDASAKVTDATQDIEFLYANKRAHDFYDRAIKELAPYEKSHVRLIAQSSDAGTVVFEKYRDIIDESVAIHRDLAKSLAALKRGEHVDIAAKMNEVNEKEADLRFRGDKLGEALGTAATAVAWVVYIIHENGEPEYPLRYAISSSDRKQMAADLTTTFGKKITKGPSPGQSYLELSAAVLYKSLTQGEGKPQKNNK